MGKFDPILTGLNGAGQFIGSFSGDAFASSNGKLIFVISDAKTSTSLFLHMVDERPRTDGLLRIRVPYGTTVQKYIWTQN